MKKNYIQQTQQKIIAELLDPCTTKARDVEQNRWADIGVPTSSLINVPEAFNALFHAIVQRSMDSSHTRLIFSTAITAITR